MEDAFGQVYDGADAKTKVVLPSRVTRLVYNLVYSLDNFTGTSRTNHRDLGRSRSVSLRNLEGHALVAVGTSVLMENLQRRYTKEFCRTLKMALRLPSTPAHTDDAAILLEADPFAADKAAAEEVFCARAGRTAVQFSNFRRMHFWEQVELPELLSVLQAAERSRSEHDALQRQVASISSEVFSEAAVAQLPDSVAVAIHEKKVMSSVPRSHVHDLTVHARSR